MVADKDSISKKLAGEEILIERARAQLHDTLQKAQVVDVYLKTWVYSNNAFYIIFLLLRLIL